MTSLTPVVIVGHVDHGKSTFIGRLLFDTGNLSADRLADIKKVSEEQGRKMEFAHVTDQFQEERDANITIDTTQIFLKIDSRPFVLIDAPGHKEYLKNMITGATQAESAIVMLDVNEGVKEQTDKHSQILKLLGIRRIAVMINKMDTVDFSEKVFRQYENDIAALFKERGLSAQAIIPISAYHGDNVAQRSPKMPWYQGPVAVEFLATCRPAEEFHSEGTLRLPVQLVINQDGENLVLGRVEQGTILAGEEIRLFPSNKIVTIKKIMKWNQVCEKAAAGENVALILNTRDSLQRGNILLSSHETSEDPSSFSVHGFWALESPIKAGDELQVECRTQTGKAIVEKIWDELDGHPLTEMQSGDVAQITLKLKSPLFVEESGARGAMSRVVFQKDGQVAGCGVIASVQ